LSPINLIWFIKSDRDCWVQDCWWRWKLKLNQTDCNCKINTTFTIIQKKVPLDAGQKPLPTAALKAPNPIQINTIADRDHFKFLSCLISCYLFRVDLTFFCVSRTGSPFAGTPVSGYGLW